jgi:hypothetical protein
VAGFCGYGEGHYSSIFWGRRSFISNDLKRRANDAWDGSRWQDVFWVFPRRLSIKSRRFGTLCRFHLQQVMKCEVLKMEPTQCSETLAFNTQTSGKYPEDILSLQQHGGSLKTRMVQDEIATGVTRVVWTADVLRCGKQIEILPHYYFSWIVSFHVGSDWISRSETPGKFWNMA